MPFELNFGYHQKVFFKKDTNLYSKFKLVDELLAELQELITVYCKNIYYVQKLQKRAHNKSVKPKSYALGDKVWLNG